MKKYIIKSFSKKVVDNLLKDITSEKLRFAVTILFAMALTVNKDVGSFIQAFIYHTVAVMLTLTVNRCNKKYKIRQDLPIRA